MYKGGCVGMYVLRNWKDDESIDTWIGTERYIHNKIHRKSWYLQLSHICKRLNRVGGIINIRHH